MQMRCGKKKEGKEFIIAISHVAAGVSDGVCGD